MPTLKNQLTAIDNNYLISIANKGLFNRAQKEIEAENITITISDSTLEATFSDGTAVTITNTLNNFSCTCPARTICKHVLMALLKASQSTLETTASNPEETTTESPNFDYLLSHTQEALIKEYGKKIYDDTLSKALSSQDYTIQEGQRLTISMLEGAITVSFLPGNSLEESICTCKVSKCHHRLEAIFYYIHFKTGELNFTLTSTSVDVDSSIIPHALSFVEDIYRIGLFRLPPEYSALCSQYATLCHGAGFATLERLFESCGRELTLYESKSAGFNINNLARRLASIYQICSAAKSGQDLAALAGKFKRKYLGLPKIHILGLGAYPWYAQSGFCGVTAVFFCPQLKRHLTFALSRPVESETQGLKVIRQFWNDKSTWDIHTGFDELSKGEYTLTSPKVSDNDRLSSSEDTKGAITNPHTDLENEKLAGVVFDDFSQLKNLFTHEEDQIVYTVLKPAKVEEGQYNLVTQEYKLPIYDKHNNCICLTIKYSKTNEPILHQCETMAAKQSGPDGITVIMSISKERFEVLAQPVAFWENGSIKNLGKDHQNAKDKKRQSHFAKFFGAAAKTP
ncbi:MAG: hypothetical protein FWE42_06545 [Defluviitaleaceae bacterium]|nr:hypothetical protein [Defluviitaleaceae bacterium]